MDRSTLLVLDIDNTLIEPKPDPKSDKYSVFQPQVGSDQWFYSLYRLFEKKPSEDLLLDKRLMTIWNDTQFAISVKPVEKITPGFLQSQYKLGIKTLLLTARRPDISDVTLRQLQSVGYTPAAHSIYDGEVTLPKEEFGTEDFAQYKRGILTVGEGNSKGVVFVKFLKKIGFQPKRVVYVDDREKHVHTMEKALSEAKIPYFGFRYGALDEKVKKYYEAVELKRSSVAAQK